MPLKKDKYIVVRIEWMMHRKVRSRGNHPVHNIIMVMLVVVLISSGAFQSCAQVHIDYLHMSRLTPNPAIAKPTLNTSDNVTLTGTVSVTKPPAVGVVYVNLTAVVPSNWTAIIVPASLKFTTGADLSYTVTVTIPARTIAGTQIVEVDGTIIVSSNDTYTRKTTGTVSVSPYYLLFLNYSELKRTAASRSFEIGITNMGNDPTSANIEIEDIIQLQKDGLKFTLNETIIGPIAPGQSTHIEFRIEYNRKKLSNSIDHINVTATYVHSRGSESTGYTNKTRIPLDLKPDRSYDPLPLSILLVIMAVMGVVLLLRGTRRHKNRKS